MYIYENLFYNLYYPKNNKINLDIIEYHRIERQYSINGDNKVH